MGTYWKHFPKNDGEGKKKSLSRPPQEMRRGMRDQDKR